MLSADSILRLLQKIHRLYQAAEIYRQSFRKPPVNWYYDALYNYSTMVLPEEIVTGIIVLKDIAEYMHE
ncbi:MAG: hypothetical protein MZV63_26475 [Marinilabiliales bacterium]|nr:hypothetical protein [Marinilabiliales bacterium]